MNELQDWDGNVDELVGHEDELVFSDEVCDRVFCSKQEAFAAGLSLGERRAEVGSR